jgi:succinate dehydrogenase / fumarate reductase, cytochrome b subunit
MLPLTKAVSSSVGKKLVMALSGIGLVVFLAEHLLGNLLLYKSDGTDFNLYARGMESFGWLLTVAELGLAGTFLLHIVLAFGLKGTNWGARPQGYRQLRSKGGKSLSNVSSRNMIVTGALILGFLVLHLWQFRFGPKQAAGYAVAIHGEQVWDLHRLVHETFGNPLYVGVYVAAMLFMGFHVRHGFWSAFQSLGAMNDRLTKPVYALGVLIAALFTVGFLFIPIWIYFDIPGALK